jgi:hypothetical protein
MKRTTDGPATVPCGPARGNGRAVRPVSRSIEARRREGRRGLAPPMGPAALGAVGSRRPSLQSHPRPGSTALAPW